MAKEYIKLSHKELGRVEVIRSVTAQRARPHYKPAPDHPWRQSPACSRQANWLSDSLKQHK